MFDDVFDPLAESLGFPAQTLKYLCCMLSTYPLVCDWHLLCVGPSVVVARWRRLCALEALCSSRMHVCVCVCVCMIYSFLDQRRPFSLRVFRFRFR
jgi:hypothetical protein